MDKEVLETLWKEYNISIGLDSQLIELLEKEARWARTTSNSTDSIPDFRNYLYHQSKAAGQ